MKFNLLKGLGGAASGFASGGPTGGVLGGLMGFAGNKKDKLKQTTTYTPEQQALFKQIMQMIGPTGQLGQGYGESLDLQRQLMDPSSEATQQFLQPYMDQFSQQTIPNLAERFAGAGALGGGLSSSGFGQALSTAGGSLENQLAALKSNLGQQAGQNLMNQYSNFSSLGLGAQPFAYVQPQQSGSTGFLQQWGQSGMPGLGQAGQGLSSLLQGILG